MVTTTPQLIELSSQTLHTQLQTQAIALIDVREPGEFAREHIENAINCPLSTFSPEDLAPHENIVLYCQTSNRSQQAAKQLLNTGISEVQYLAGGLEQWKAAELPTIENKQAPLPMMRQVQIAAGSLVLAGTILSAFVSPWFLLLTGFVGSGLIFAGTTGFCGMAKILAKLPYNQVK